MHNQCEAEWPIAGQFLRGAEFSNSYLESNLHEIAGKKVVFTGEGGMVPLEGWQSRLPDIPELVTTIRPVRDGSLIAAVDSSSVKVADTEDGALYAAKCGVALGHAQKPLMHFKIGPNLFYVTEKTVSSSSLNQRLARLVLLDSEIAKRLIRIRMERSVQLELAQRLVRGIILIDGSLRSSQFEARNQRLEDVMESGALNRNCLVGISKGTSLKVLQRLAGTLSSIPYSSSLDVTSVIKSLVHGVAGSTVLAKFSASAPVLRTDIVEAQDGTLGRVIGNDSIANGYPETLRLAHHISTFSSAEIAGVRTHLVANFRVTELASDDLRASLLGSMPV